MALELSGERGFRNQNLMGAGVLCLALALAGCGHLGFAKKSTPPAGFSTPHAVAAAPAARDCSSTREYATTLMFLRENPNFAGNEAQARAIADQVSLGCSGAAKRFLNTVALLQEAQEAETDNQTIRELAVGAAQADDATAAAFSAIFQKAFLQSHLDLDIALSVELARSLSINFKGDPAKAERDFGRLVQFCVGDQSLSLSRQQCAEFSARLAGYGAVDQREIFPAFKEIYGYLTSDIEARPSIGDALKISEEVVKTGPLAVENFKQAFKFANSKKGLDLKEPDAIEFARKMAARSRQAISR